MEGIDDIKDIAIEQYFILQERPLMQLGGTGTDDYSPHEMRFERGFADRGTKESRRLRHLSAREQGKLREEFYRQAERY